MQLRTENEIEEKSLTLKLRSQETLWGTLWETLWDAVDCSGALFDARGRSGKLGSSGTLWDVLECSRKWDASGRSGTIKHKLVVRNGYCTARSRFLYWNGISKTRWWVSSDTNAHGTLYGHSGLAL